MTYEELHRRYGSYVSQRVRRELTADEFSSLSIDDLTQWLENRAEAAHENYIRMMNNPSRRTRPDAPSAGEACRLWREAEDLAYLVVVAEDVDANARAV